MSTWLYLECATHNPPLRSINEVGQHLTDLPNIREYFHNRKALAADHENLWRQWHTRPAFADYGLQEYYWPATAGQFFHEHPHCDVVIRDEYGDTHPAQGDES